MSALSQDLLEWYDQHQREMPWRTQPGPYRTWISEAMLQQTRVETARPYFERFMQRFPTVSALAEAPLDDVLSLWAGLGYYSRARNLHKAARLVEELGAFPETVEGLLKLPGVGPYMAGAIASIALGLDVPTVDGNIVRVLSRVHREAGGPKVIWDLAERHIPQGRAGDHNQALMDLGATVCTPRSPKCPACPITLHCEAQHVGDIQDFPPPKKRKKSPVWSMASAVIVREGTVLLGKRPTEGLFGGLYEPPMFRVSKGKERSELMTSLGGLGLTVEACRAAPGVRHILSHRVLEVSCFAVDAVGRPSSGDYQEVRWVEVSDAAQLGLSTLARKIIDAALPPE